MDLKILVGTKKMCMFHEPAGFWPNIFLHIFLGALKSHYPVCRRERPGNTNAVKVNWRYFNFMTTSRTHTLRENARIFHKSLSKSVKNVLFWGSCWLKSTPKTLIPANWGVIESESSYNPVLKGSKERESCILAKIELDFPLTRGRTVQCRNYGWSPLSR